MALDDLLQLVLTDEIARRDSAAADHRAQNAGLDPSMRLELFAERLMTVAHTARKQNKNVLAFLTACGRARLAPRPVPSLFVPDLGVPA